ncbi:MAG: adenylosuccinate lyase [Planctomycetota bacterium]
MEPGDRFDHPLIERYASRDMARLFSPRVRHGTWRDLWIALAQAQHELGFPVTKEQVEELRAHRNQFDWEKVATYEKQLRHDVMAHVHHFGDLCPKARPIIHLGATSCFVTDNADLLIYRDALRLITLRLGAVLRALATFADRWKAEPCLGYTHFQVAQPVTVGKRACLWAQDFAFDLDEVRRVVDWLPFRGVKGTTGTQATFLVLAGGDHRKVEELETRVTRAMGFRKAVALTGQTYPRKIDWTIHQVLSAIAQSASKFATDLRLLSHEGELEEPAESTQVGSSAMAYKKNPMRCERVCSLARYVIEVATTSAHTAATQWLERTLDDSAVRRIALPESFLAIDGILVLVENVARGLVVYPKVIEKKLREQLPFLGTEEILMAGVAAGGDRQDLHERVRVHSREAARAVKAEGRANPLLQLIAEDPAFAAIRHLLPGLMDPRRFIGRSVDQVDAFLRDEVTPRLANESGAVPAADVRV